MAAIVFLEFVSSNYYTIVRMQYKKPSCCAETIDFFDKILCEKSLHVFCPPDPTAELYAMAEANSLSRTLLPAKTLKEWIVCHIIYLYLYMSLTINSFVAKG